LAWLARAGGQPGVQRLEGLAVQRGGGSSSDSSGGLGRAGALALLPPRASILVAVGVALSPLEEGEGKEGREEGKEGG